MTEDEIFNVMRRTGIVTGSDCDTLAEKLSEELNKRTCVNCEHWRDDNLGKYCWLSTEDMGEKDYCSKFTILPQQ